MRFPLLAAAALCLTAAPSHAAYFGKNKVQYRDFTWRVLETQHFEIHFYDREAAVVEDAARLAERAYVQLAAALKHEFSRRIPVVLYASHSDFQQTNITDSFIDIGTGGVTDILRRRVFLPFTGSWAELEHVLTHELVHAFELDILYDSKNAAQPMSPGAFAPPLWVMEGLAEYLSRGSRDTHTDMWVRDACLAGNLPSVEQLGWVRDIRVYRFGQSVWAYFAEQYGADKIGPLLIAMREKKDFGRAMEEVTGESLTEFSEGWRTAMRRHWLPTLADHQVTREFATPVVTRRGEGASMLLGATISPDGKRLAYISDRGLNHELWVRDIEGKASPHRLVAGETSGDFESLRFFSASSAWSPDGRTIAFAAKSGGEDALYLLDSHDGEVHRRLTFGLDEVQTATFSPDGEEIVFVGLQGGESDLYRVRRDGSDLRRLTHDRHVERDPQWSPDGSTLAFVTDAGPGTDFEALRFGRMHVALLDLATGTQRDVTPFATGKAISPAWSSDGQSIAFISDRDGTPNVYILHLPTGQVFRLTDSATGVSGLLPTSPALAWAREGSRLVFTAFGESGWDVYRIDDPMVVARPVDLEPGELVPVPPAPVEVASLEGALIEMETAVAAAPAPNSTEVAAEPTPAEPSPPLETPAPADSTPALAPDDPTGFKVRPYKVKLRPDLSNLGGVVGYDAGFAGQSQLQFTDLLGNYSVTVGLGIYGSIKESDLYLSFMNRSGRTNYALSAFQFRRRYGVIGRGAGTPSSRQTYRGVQVSAQRPFDKFTRVEASLKVAGVEGRYFLGETAQEAATDPTIETMRTFVGPSIAYVVDSALWGISGPIKGRRMRLAAEGGVGQLQFVTLEADLREYWNVRKWYTVAGRFYGVTSHGNSPETVYLGGAQSLRGYDYGTLLGNHALLASAEFRFPLLRHVAFGWPLPLEFGTVQGVLFADAATAWDHELFRTSRAVTGLAAGRRALLSTGIGARINLGALVLKLDWAQLHDTATGRRSSGSSVALGTDF